MNDLQILTVKEVCDLLNCSVPTIYRWEKEGTLPFPKIRISRHKVGFRKSDVEEFLNSQSYSKPTPEAELETTSLQ